MKIKNILNIKGSKIRIFPFQSNDHDFILYPDLQVSYLLTLLIDKIWFNLFQFTLTYIYPTKKFIEKIFEDLKLYEEDYFLFYLENFIHSYDYSLWFMELVLEQISKQKNKPKIIIHTLKTPESNIKKIIEKYDFVLLIIHWDIEEFFYDIFINKKDILKLWNICYKEEDSWQVIYKKWWQIISDLNNYILTAYASGYYNYFPKVKDELISFLDDDNSFTNTNVYHSRPKKKNILDFRYNKEISAMLSSWRWCKYNCIYCYRWVKYSKLRQISLKTLKKDLDYLAKMKYEYIYFYDDCFITTNLDRLDNITDLLQNYTFEYWIAAKYEVCSSLNLKKIAKLKIKRIQIWLQSISTEVNLWTKRLFDKIEFERNLVLLNNYWISVALDLILGLPWDSLKWFIETFNYAIKLKPKSIYINALFLNPWTELYKDQKKYGIVKKLSNWKKHLFHVDTVKSNNDFSEKDIVLAKKYVWYYMKKITNINIILR